MHVMHEEDELAFTAANAPPGVGVDRATGSVLHSPPDRPLDAEEPVVLVVDADRVTRRFVEMALGRRHLRVESVADLEQASALLQMLLVDLVLCASRLPDGEGLALCRRLAAGGHRAGALPFVVLSADARLPAKIAAFDAGADDYLVKPCDAGELRARVHALLRKARRQRRGADPRGVLSGDLSALPFADLLTTLEGAQRTGVLDLATTRAVGQVHLVEGRVVHASYANLGGLRAVARLLGEGRGQFEFTIEEPVPAARRTIDVTSTTALILEAARLLDEERAGKLDGDGAVWPVEQAEGHTMSRRRGVMSPQAIWQIELGLAEQGGRGEVCLLTGEQLAEWSEAAHAGGEHLLVLLVATAASAVPALLRLGGGLRELEMARALAREPVTLVASRRFARCAVDVVLATPERLPAVVPSLRQVPHLMLIEAGGPAKGLSARLRAELDLAFRELSPVAVLGLGAWPVEEYFRQFAALRRGRAGVAACPAAVAAGGELNLQLALTRGLSLWASTTRRW